MNENRFLTEDEMVPIMVRLYPSEGSYARQQAEHLLNEVLYYLPCLVLGVMQIEIFVSSILF